MTTLHAPPGPPTAVERTRGALEAALADTTPVDLAWIDPPPAPDGWTLAADALRFLTRLVAHLRPGHVLEFGSGLSTRALARACATLRPPGAVSSIDHDPEFGGSTARALAEAPVPGGRVAVQIAPLVARDYGGKLVPVYHLDAARFASPRPVDLVVVDGPTVVLGGREGTLYQALEFSRPGTLLVLDDADRAAERAALACWRDNLGDAVEVRVLGGFTKGLAAVIVADAVPRESLWDHRVALTARDLAAAVPPGARLILVDGNAWGGAIAPGRPVLPFLERDGEYRGAPADDAEAIAETERLRCAGARFLAVGWPASWWLAYYGAWARHLRGGRCLLDNDRLVVFDLESR